MIAALLTAIGKVLGLFVAAIVFYANFTRRGRRG